MNSPSHDKPAAADSLEPVSKSHDRALPPSRAGGGDVTFCRLRDERKKIRLMQCSEIVRVFVVGLARMPYNITCRNIKTLSEASHNITYTRIHEASMAVKRSEHADVCRGDACANVYVRIRRRPCLSNLKTIAALIIFNFYGRLKQYESNRFSWNAHY